MMAYTVDENGNYKRTVRCGHCYEKGHNKSSCPELRKRLRENIANAKAAIEKNVWEYDWQERDAKNRLRRSAEQLHKLESKGKSRKCGYCGELGHTRRTCQKRKDEVIHHTERTLKFRRELCDRFIANGLGPGALVAVDAREWTNDHTTDQNALAIVTRIDFSELRDNHKYDGTRWGTSSPRMLHLSLVQPVKSSWNDRLIERVTEMPNVTLLNTDDHDIHTEYQRGNRGLKHIISKVECDRSMMSADSIDEKSVSKWVLNNIVDPK
jgi:hypothetical protein